MVEVRLGLMLKQQGQLDEAESLLRRTLGARERLFTSDHPATLGSYHHLGALLLERGDLEEAERRLQQAFEGRRSTLGWPSRATIESTVALAEALERQRRRHEAVELLEEGYAALATARGSGDPGAARLGMAAAAVYERWHESDPETGHDARAAEWRSRSAPPNPPG
jgi:tetratricopeptide (TPR) repeat protein